MLGRLRGGSGDSIFCAAHLISVFLAAPQLPPEDIHHTTHMITSACSTSTNSPITMPLQWPSDCHHLPFWPGGHTSLYTISILQSTDAPDLDITHHLGMWCLHSGVVGNRNLLDIHPPIHQCFWYYPPLEDTLSSLRCSQELQPSRYPSSNPPMLLTWILPTTWGCNIFAQVWSGTATFSISILQSIDVSDSDIAHCLCYSPTLMDYISMDLVNFSLFFLSYLIISDFELILYENPLISHPSHFHKHVFASWQTLFY